MGNKSRLKLKLIFFTLIVFFSFQQAFAADIFGGFKYGDNGNIAGTINNEVLIFTKFNRNIPGYVGYTANTPTYNSSTKVGDYYILDVSVANKNSGRLSKVHDAGSTSSYVYNNQLITIYNSGTQLNANGAPSSTTATGPNVFSQNGFYSDLFKTSCPDNETALSCWVGKVFVWSEIALVTASIGAIIAAGILYMVSMGDPKRIEMAKKLLIGAFSGLAVIILGRFFLKVVIGVPWTI